MPAVGWPLAVDATSDGYVHEKWGGVPGRGGQPASTPRGPLTSPDGPHLNCAENITSTAMAGGTRERHGIDEAERDFEGMWARSDPCLPRPFPAGGGAATTRPDRRAGAATLSRSDVLNLHRTLRRKD